MLSQFTPNPSISESRNGGSALVVTTAVSGLILGALFNWLLPMAGVGALAFWLLGMGIAMLAVGLATVHRSGESQWGLVFAGQVVGVTAVALLLIAA